MTNEEYKKLSIKEFTKAAGIYEGDKAGIFEMCQSGESACAASSRNQEVLTARNCFAPSLTFLIRSPLGCNECPQRSLISWISG